MKIMKTAKGDYKDKVRIIIDCNRSAADSLMPLLEQIKIMGNIGSSRSITIEDWNRDEEWAENGFGFDGDGPDRIDEIKLEDK